MRPKPQPPSTLKATPWSAKTLGHPLDHPLATQLVDLSHRQGEGLLARVGDPYTHTLTTQRKSKAARQHAQIGLPSHLRILFLIFLISMALNSCGGACVQVNTDPKSRPCSHRLALSFICILLPILNPEN